MPPWAWFAVVCGVLSVVGLLVDRRSREVRAGLEVPADRVGRGSDPSGSAGRVTPYNVGGLTVSGGDIGGYSGGGAQGQ